MEEIVPVQALRFLSINDLGLHLAGGKRLDIDDMKKYTVFENGNEQIEKWFWEVLNEFNEDLKCHFVKYITGCYSVKENGWKNVELKIKFVNSDLKLPRAQVCISTFEIPLYKNKKELKFSIMQILDYNFDEEDDYE